MPPAVGLHDASADAAGSSVVPKLAADMMSVVRGLLAEPLAGSVGVFGGCLAGNRPLMKERSDG